MLLPVFAEIGVIAICDFFLFLYFLFFNISETQATQQAICSGVQWVKRLSLNTGNFRPSHFFPGRQVTS